VPKQPGTTLLTKSVYLILFSCLLLSSGTAASESPGAKFDLYKPAREIPALRFTDGAGQKTELDRFRGGFVLLNIWATWCGPCQREMAALDRLQGRRGGKGFAVLALSIDRGGPASVREFYARKDLRHLAIYNDVSGDSARLLDARGIPATFLIGPDGRALWRIDGDIDWDSETAQTLIDYFISQTPPLG